MQWCNEISGAATAARLVRTLCESLILQLIWRSSDKPCNGINSDLLYILLSITKTFLCFFFNHAVQGLLIYLHEVHD
jgi:hypothetical protein